MFQFYEPELRCRKQKRVLKSYFISLFYSFSIGLILGLLLFLFGHQFLSLFATDAAVIDAGMQRIKIMAFSYCVSSFMDCTIAASVGSERPSSRRSLSSWAPASSVSYGSTRSLPGSTPSRHCFFCICFHGSSHRSQRSSTLLSATGNSASGS